MRDELVMVIPRDTLFAGARPFQGFAADAGPYLRTALGEYLFMPRRHAEQDTRYKQIIPYVTVRTSPVPGQGPLYLMFQRAGGGDPRLGRLYSIGLGGHVNAGDVLPSPLVFGVGEARRRLAGSAPSARPPMSSTPGRAARLGGREVRPGAASQSGQPARSGDQPPRTSQAKRLKRRVRLDSSLREAVRPAPTARLDEHPLFRGLRRELREEVMFPPGAALSLLGAINDDTSPVGQVHFGLAFLLVVPAAAGPGGRGLPGPVARRRRRRPVVQVDLARRRAGVRLRREPGGTLQVGSLFNLDQVRAYAQAMETWSLLLLQAGVLDPA
ncbi:MAG: hypothetical protein Q8P31_12440 [Bacillota bacterium]|nr:hypothetical protein [Bacillota bacterium]